MPHCRPRRATDSARLRARGFWRGALALASGAAAARAAATALPGPAGVVRRSAGFAQLARSGCGASWPFLRRLGGPRQRVIAAAAGSEAPVVDAPIDPYLTLGINPGASTEEIRKAYRKVAIQRHPDRNGGTPEAIEAFRAVVKAYETLAPDGKTTTETPDEEEVLAGAIEALAREKDERTSRIEARKKQIEQAKEDEKRQIAELSERTEETIEQLLQSNKDEEASLVDLAERLKATRDRRSKVVGNLRASSAASAALAGAAIAGPVGAAAGLVFGTLFADDDNAAGKVARSMGKLGQKLGDWVERGQSKDAEE